MAWHRLGNKSISDPMMLDYWCIYTASVTTFVCRFFSWVSFVKLRHSVMQGPWVYVSVSDCSCWYIFNPFKTPGDSLSPQLHCNPGCWGDWNPQAPEGDQFPGCPGYFLETPAQDRFSKREISEPLIQVWESSKLCSLISPVNFLGEILIKLIGYLLSITFIFVRCLRSSAVVTPVQY